MLLSKLLVNGCLAVFNNYHLSQQLVFLLSKLPLLLLALLLLYILKIQLVEAFALINDSLLVLLRLLQLLTQLFELLNLLLFSLSFLR